MRAGRTSAACQVRGKTVTVIFRKPYAAWEALISGNIYPAASLRGANVNTLYQSSLDVSSGPYRFSSWQKGTQLVLVKNATFRAGPQARLDRLVFRYIPNTASLFQSLRSNEIQVTEPQPQLQIVEIRRNSSYRVQSGPGYFFEHMDLQQGPQGHPALKRKYVRQALIQSINRADVRNALYVNSGLVASAAQLPVLQSLIWKPFEANYRPFFARWALQPAGCDRAAPRERLHRWSDHAEPQQHEHLDLPRCREAVVPLQHHRRQPASCADVRDRPEPD